MIKRIEQEYKCAYVAGLFDGEGHISCFRTGINGKSQVLVGITNTVKKPLELVQGMFGGKISGRARNNPNAKYIYTWIARNNEAYMFLLAVKMFVIIKLEKTKAAIEILRLILRKNKLGLHSQFTIDKNLEIFGSLVYIENKNRYTITCLICGNEYKRRNTRGITCSPVCRKALVDKLRRKEIDPSVVEEAKRMF